MLRIAADVGYSETAFLTGEVDGGWTVRYFSPRAEVAFCGHATIALAVAPAERRGPGRLVLDTRAGEVEVRTGASEPPPHAEAGPGTLTATLTSVPTRTRPAPGDSLGEALAALRWAPADLDPRYPAHVADAGNDHLVVAVRSRALLAGLDDDFAALGSLMARAGWTTVHAVWSQSPTVFHARDPSRPEASSRTPPPGPRRRSARPAARQRGG